MNVHDFTWNFTKPCEKAGTYHHCLTHRSYMGPGDLRCLAKQLYDMGVESQTARIAEFEAALEKVRDENAKLRSALQAIKAHPSDEAWPLKMTAEEALR